MPAKNIVTGQHVEKVKLERAQEFRHRMTPVENKLWQRLRAGRLEGYHFRRQQVIDRFIVDFYCHSASLVVEVDGGIHQDQVDYDRERDLYLQGRGLKVLRFTNLEVNSEFDVVLGKILEACRQPNIG